MAITENKNKVSSLAKDFGMQSKDIIAILKDYTEAPKGHSQVLSDRELSIVFDYLTLHHQVKIETIFAETYTEKKEEPKAAPAPAASAPKAAPAPAANTQPGAAKTAAPQTAAPKAAPAAAQTALGKSTATQQPTTRVPEKKIVDTRKSTNVNLDKYDEKLQDMAERSSAGGGRRDNLSAGKEKFRSAANKKNGRGAPTFSNKRRQEEAEKMRRLQLEIAKKTPLTVKIPDEISVGELASRMKKTGAEVVKCLMKNGVMASLSQMIDFDTASFVAEELGCKVEKEVVVTIEEKLIDDHEDTADELKPRAPVVVVMGHVDHGKTSLLDAIRQSNITSHEAGGITQHIGAYQVRYEGKKITFMDTPGHEAFTAMRARGAQVTDIAVLVVAADDGVMPQTIESINHAKSANVPIIVAINKIDKESANPQQVMQQLTEYGLISEEWGGDTIMVPVSAHKKIGLDELLENILVLAEVQELKANPNRPAQGVVIEAKLDKGRGPVASVLIQKGTLHVGDTIIVGSCFGKVRAMTNERGERVKKAEPSIPVEILGLNDVPEAGDILDVTDEKTARSVAEKRLEKKRSSELHVNAKVTLDDLFNQIQQGELKELSLIVKGDVQGSVEALSQSLMAIKSDEVRIAIVHSGVGAINESDIMLASASNALIIGFNVRPDASARKAAEHENVDMRTYRVIYDAINDVEAAIKGMLEKKYEEKIIGRADVRKVITTPKVIVGGSYIKEGKITSSAKVRLIRNGIVVHEGEVAGLRRFKDDVKEVAEGYECGITLEGYRDIKEGDEIEAYEMVEVEPQ